MWCRNCIAMRRLLLHIKWRICPSPRWGTLFQPAPMQRGEVSVLEDFPTLRDVQVTMHVSETIEKVLLIPQKEEIPFVVDETGGKITVPEINGHQMVVVQY